MSNNFIGDLIFKTALETIKSAAVPQVTAKEAPAVARAVTEDLKPIIEFKTNNEQWYQSYVTLGSLGSVLISLGAIVQAVSDPSTLDLGTLAPHVTVILTAAFALFGRWRAKKAIGA